MDLNNDGKHDFKDDAILYQIISNDDETKNTAKHTDNKNYAPTKGKWSASTIIPLLYLGLLIPGDIPINGFTMSIGLLCVGVLAVKFLMWLYQ